VRLIRRVMRIIWRLLGEEAHSEISGSRVNVFLILAMLVAILAMFLVPGWIQALAGIEIRWRDFSMTGKESDSTIEGFLIGLSIMGVVGLICILMFTGAKYVDQHVPRPSSGRSQRPGGRRRPADPSQRPGGRRRPADPSQRPGGRRRPADPAPGAE
jgi:hypothetical protein